MSKISDLSGKKFNRIKIIEFSHSEKGNSVWKCQCDCGKIFYCQARMFKHEKTKSCGCLKKEKWKKRITTHGMAYSPEYIVWNNMKNRCNNKNHTSYNLYGGRKIKICERWINSFENFFEDMGHRPKNHTLERIDNDGDYTPDNCKWATRKKQNMNKSDNHLITFNNNTQTLGEWADEIGIKYTTLFARIKRGWALEKALKK